ncbi:MAG: FMN-binding negative transcriptional regulator [Acetobacteraceae bacterium]|nr:FMN-binding negative transcriptional regulator [Acetobacteraceae bacterium]
MHLRPAFVETDLDRIVDLIRANNFGLLVTNGPDGMDASHIPFVVERRGDTLVLTGHLAKANRQCALFDGGTALAIFSGPHAYISPSWYKTQPSVPTWDYSAVHLHGTLERMEDSVAMLAALAEHDPGRFDFSSQPEKYRSAMLAGIVSFRMVASKIEAQWKMSQNRSVEDRQGVIDALRESGQHAVADEIAATLPKE